MIVVGGVPGAGKSTALRPYVGRRGVTVLDPDGLRGRLHARVLVHAVHQAVVWGATLLGPGVLGTLLVHDTATRPRRRRAFLRLAAWRGWDVSLLLVDVARSTAVTGQLERGRLTPPAAFERHWRRWGTLRADPAADGVPTRLVTRDRVPVVLAGLVEPAARMVPCSPHPAGCCC